MTSARDIWDDLFHGCAWAAYFDEALATQGRPDSEATRRRAFQYYEEELARKNGQRDSLPSLYEPEIKHFDNSNATETCPAEE
jgi:hypothetical protein